VQGRCRRVFEPEGQAPSKMGGSPPSGGHIPRNSLFSMTVTAFRENNVKEEWAPPRQPQPSWYLVTVLSVFAWDVGVDFSMGEDPPEGGVWGPRSLPGKNAKSSHFGQFWDMFGGHTCMADMSGDIRRIIFFGYVLVYFFFFFLDKKTLFRPCLGEGGCYPWCAGVLRLSAL
jgi:hypothetical protein